MNRQELQQALALLFRRFREDQVPETDLTKMMSLTLNWGKPSQAPYLLARGVEAGFLEKEEDLYTPTFDATEVDIPFGFQPGDELFEETALPEPDPEQGTSETDAPSDEGDASSAPAEDQAAPEASSGDQPLLETLLDELAGSLEDGRKGAVARVNAKQEDLGQLITLEAAALIVAAEEGLAVEALAGQVLADLQAA